MACVRKLYSLLVLKLKVSFRKESFEYNFNTLYHNNPYHILLFLHIDYAIQLFSDEP